MALIGTAADAGAFERPVPSREVRTATTSTVPQVPHSGQRPTHFAVTWWHSEQRYCERGREPALPRRDGIRRVRQIPADTASGSYNESQWPSWRAALPAEIGTDSVVLPAFSKVKVKS